MARSEDEDVEIPEPDEVRRRLTELGLTVELLLGAVHQGQSAADFCTASHPRYYPGSVAAGETIAGLRDRTAALGWSFDDEDNIATTISPDETVVLTACSGDEQTGLRAGRHAQTKRPRGAASVRHVRRRTQYELDALLPPEERRPNVGDLVPLGPMWYLLFHREKGTDTVRSELSCAMGVSDTGALLEWSERLILPELNMLNGGPLMPRERDGDPSPDVDVLVERRAS